MSFTADFHVVACELLLAACAFELCSHCVANLNLQLINAYQLCAALDIDKRSNLLQFMLRNVISATNKADQSPIRFQTWEDKAPQRTVYNNTSTK